MNSETLITESYIDDLKNQIKLLQHQIKTLSPQPRSTSGNSHFEDNFENSINTEKHSFTRTILENMGDVVFVKDSQFRIIYANKAFSELFDLPMSKIIGQTLFDHVPDNERDSFLEIDQRVLSFGIEIINIEYFSISHRNERILSTRKSLYTDNQGNKFIIGVSRDITESQKAEELLKESEEQFRNLNASKDQLISIIAHDLRSPFSSILALSDLLLETNEKPNSPETEEFLKMINNTTKNTLGLLDNLLNWGRAQKTKVKLASKKINLSQLIQEVLEQSNSIAKCKHISLKQLGSREVMLFTDNIIVKTILRNLVSNAIKFTKTGGSVTVSAVQMPHKIEVCVSDNGIGISEKSRKKLFSMDSNISSLGTENENGSGFGLVLCKEFVDKLGGEIWVESELGVGSHFKFFLPTTI